MSNPSFNDDARILGDTDETLIGNVGDRLKVTMANSSGGSSHPLISNKYRVDFQENGVSIGASFMTIYSYSGSGNLHGFIFDFVQNGVEVKLTIDGEIIFDVDMGDFENLFETGTSGQDSWCGIGIGASDRLKFCPPWPIPYETEVKVEAKKTGGPDKDLARYMVALTKET